MSSPTPEALRKFCEGQREVALSNADFCRLTGQRSEAPLWDDRAVYYAALLALLDAQASPQPQPGADLRVLLVEVLAVDGRNPREHEVLCSPSACVPTCFRAALRRALAALASSQRPLAGTEQEQKS